MNKVKDFKLIPYLNLSLKKKKKIRVFWTIFWGKYIFYLIQTFLLFRWKVSFFYKHCFYN